MHAWDVLAGAPVKGNVLVADWGGDWTGLDVTEALAERGLSVQLVCAAASVGENVHVYQRNAYLDRLDRAGVVVHQHLEPVALEPGAVVLRNVFSDRRTTLAGIDTLVVSAGRSGSEELFVALQDGGADVTRVGDALGPRSFEEAIAEGTRAALGVSLSL